MTTLPRIATDLRVNEKELHLIDQARQKTKQSRNHFVSKAAVDRAIAVIKKYANTNSGVEEAMSDE